ncbi:hypothetical protein ABB37_07011 [Leptomonas pyrrhocoris]|uniref:Uncharacterized protein n=1 Tax=Leptomonas pyrrhocoris TaxID=157538 RepID=A0A0M9FWZ7_LEPPY|nr:hypothetical protein ABB37_07011 [Leptomonas pyrrhocoris]KPA77667.1 hypothetical protein ABB37_07011 [Leptomonas pyrrhocoris]|eukprot:XP_015656106.1 hypothetical protein ABB37_07011 [Leptomonas pyrrhocoris]
METSSPAVPIEPVITIISSDGETFSLSAQTVAHSHLLEGALRKWAEVYQVQMKPPAHAGRSGSLPGEDADDATTTDATADDPEETPDERFIEGYYDETASDVSATSGMIEDTLNNLDGRAAAAAGEEALVGSEVDQPKVMRMVSVPVNGEEADAVESGGAPAEGDIVDDSEDSDRTASVLPSPHEGSMSSSTTPTKTMDSSNGDATASVGGVVGSGLGAAPRSISPFVRDVSSSPPTSLVRDAAGDEPSGQGNGSSCNGGLSGVSASTGITGGPGDAVDCVVRNQLPAVQNGAATRLPANMVISPDGHGSQTSPSALMDADQSTPSVLSEEEVEAEEQVRSGDGVGPAKVHGKADPRNLGDEGLDDAAAPIDGVVSPTSPSPSPEAAAIATSTNVHSDADVPNRDADPVVPALGSPNGNAEVHTSSGNRDDDKKLTSPSSRDGFIERRRSAVVVTAGAAEEDTDDVVLDSSGSGISINISSNSNGCARDSCTLPEPMEAATTTTAAAASSTTPSHTPGSFRSGSGHLSASPAPDWRSPTSCHQRTPCIADEDDVGAMVSDDDENGVVEEAEKEENGAAAAATVPAAKQNSTNPIRASAVGGTEVTAPSRGLTASDDTTTVAAASLAADPGSSLVYSDGIRITSSAIVFDLLPVISSVHTSLSTSMMSPQSLRKAIGSPDVMSTGQDSLTLTSAGGTVAGGDEASRDKFVDPTTAPTVAAAAAAITATGGESTTTTAAAAPPGPKMIIHSSILVLCIKYMTHFAEAEAQAAAAAAAAAAMKAKRRKRGRRRRHRHRRQQQQQHDPDHSFNQENGDGDSSSDGSTATSSTSSSTDVSGSSSSDNNSDSEADSLTGSYNSINAPVIISVPLPPPSGAAAAAVAGAGVGAAPSAEAANVLPCGPAAIPMPLTRPLVTFLSPWERSFLYLDLLGAPESVLTAALAIQEVCPDFDYFCPGPCLRNARAKAALMTPPPPSEGVHTLVEVMRAAKQLQIDPLHALCTGWLADFMIRVSYGATDNFEAAHLIRQCLRVPSDWNRRETDCLKLENEWPANEEAE